eukprot:6459528-Amphidinium_carterae.2
MEPTAADLQTFSELTPILGWAGVVGDPADAASESASLLTHVGFTQADHPRYVAALSLSRWESFLEGWTLPGDQAANARQYGAALLFYQGCRRACPLPTEPQPGGAQVSTALTPEPKENRTVKLNLTVDPSKEESAALMSSEEVERAYTLYRRTMGAPPSAAEEATTEQLSAVRALLLAKVVPYVDMTLWTPFNLRLQRKMATTGLQLGADGTFKRVELKAPPDIETWRAAYKVLKTTLISFGAVSPARLERYSDLVSKFASQYGAHLWGAVYSAEVKMRHEHMERLRRRGAIMLTPATDELPTYDPEYPWEWVWSAAVVDRSFWHEELEGPVLEARSQGLLAVQTAAGSDTPYMAPHPPPSKKRPAPRSIERQHKLNAEGLFEVNRKGSVLCTEYNSGGCNQRPGRCPQGNKVHQCARCLGDHPSVTCHSKPRPPTLPKGRGKGRGSS